MYIKFYRVMKNPYEPFKNEIESIKREKVFSDWFDETDREFFFIKFPDEIKEDELVFEFFEEHGFSIVDYKKGLARKKGGKRDVRIGRLFNKIKKNEEKELRKENKGESESTIKKYLEAHFEHIDEVKMIFENSPSRVSGNRFVVVISQKTEDIAKMSTDRGWTSCMELGSGVNYKSVFCEVEKGGLIAYLTRAEDVDVQKPIARILLRRFVNEEGLNIIIPEETTYPNEYPGFRESVVKWLLKKQPNIPIGVYKLEGGGYSDSFNSFYFYFPDNLEVEEIINYLNIKRDDKRFIRKKYLVNYKDNLPEELLSRELHQYDEYMGYNGYEYEEDAETIQDFLDKNLGTVFFKEKEAEEFIYKLNNDYNYYLSSFMDEMEYDDFYDFSTEELEILHDNYKDAFVLEISEINNVEEVKKRSAFALLEKPVGSVDEKYIKKILNMQWGLVSGKSIINKASNQYSHLITKDIILKYKINPSQMSKTKDIEFFVDRAVEFIQQISDDPKTFILPHNESSLSNYGQIITITNKFHEKLDLIGNFYKRIPEPIVRNLVSFSTKFRKDKSISGVPPIKSPIKGHKEIPHYIRVDRHIVHFFSSSDVDTPSALSYIEGVFGYWKKDNNLYDSVLYFMYKAGRNSLRFIDVIEKEIKELEDNYGKEELLDDSFNKDVSRAKKIRYEKLLTIRFKLLNPGKKSPYSFFPE